MSWSVNFIGTPEKISEALDKESQRLSEQNPDSKAEFDEVLPHMKALVGYNTGLYGPIQLTANGHTYPISTPEGLKRNATFNIELKPCPYKVLS